MKNLGRFTVTEELLVDALHLPEGTRIVEIKNAGDPYRFGYELVVEAEGIGKPRVGEKVRAIMPMFKSTKAKCGHIVERFVGWGK